MLCEKFQSFLLGLLPKARFQFDLEVKGTMVRATVFETNQFGCWLVSYELSGQYKQYWPKWIVPTPAQVEQKMAFDENKKRWLL